MTISNPSFYGARLREAREARGFTMEQLGGLVGVKKQSISLYEMAKCQPADETFDRIVKALRVPRTFFSRPPLPACGRPIFYRSMASATKRVRDQAESRFDWFRRVVGYLAEHVEFPAVQFPDDEFPADPAAISAERVEEGAETLRRHWGLGDGPISNVLMLMENKGVLSTRYELEANTLDAFSVWDEYTGRPLMVLSADKGSAVRSRFDAAHECGHLFIHRNVPRPLLSAPASFKLIEQQAHQFARCFLLPERSFSREHVPSGIAGWKALKEKWKVSMAALILRAEELGMVSQNQVRNLYIGLSRYGWRRQEPFDDVWEPETPLVIPRSVRLVLDAGEVSKPDFLYAVGCDPADVEQLAGLPERFFDDEPGADELEPGPKLLPFRKPPTAPPGQGGQSAV